MTIHALYRCNIYIHSGMKAVGSRTHIIPLRDELLWLWYLSEGSGFTGKKTPSKAEV
jgi:hypothetical protein